MENKLKTCEWGSVYSTSGADDAVTVLNELIVSLFNECFPLIKVKISSRAPPPPVHVTTRKTFV